PEPFWSLVYARALGQSFARTPLLLWNNDGPRAGRSRVRARHRSNRPAGVTTGDSFIRGARADPATVRALPAAVFPAATDGGRLALASCHPAPGQVALRSPGLPGSTLQRQTDIRHHPE